MGIRLISVEMDWAWQKMCVQKLLFQILSRHLSDTVLILFRHCLDIAWLIYKVSCNFSCGWIQYLSETVHTLSGQCPCTVQTLSRWTELGKKCVYKNFCFKYFPDTFQTLSGHCPDTVWTLSGHCPDTVQTLSRHCLDIVWLISKACFNFSCGWVGGWINWN